MKLVVVKTGEIQTKSHPDSISSSRNPYEVIETRTQDPSGGTEKRVSNCLRNGVA